MEKYIELARKLKALADRGMGGEKTTAQKLLDNYMKKHGLTILDIEGEKRDRECFTIAKKYRRLFMHVASTVIGIRIESAYGKRSIIAVDVTKAEKIEINIKFSFYKRAYDNDLKLFLRSFIVKNDLFPFDGKKSDSSKLTDEEIAELRKVFKMSENLDKAHYSKQLKD